MTGFQIWFVVFLVLIGVVGVFSLKRVKDSESFVTANSSLGFFQIFGNTVAYCIGSYALLTNSGMGFAQGATFIFAPLAFYVCVILTPVLFAKTVKDNEITTVPQFFTQQFGKGVGTYVVLIVGLFSIFVLIVVQILGLSSAITTFFDMDINVAKVISFVLCVGLTLMGGMVSVSRTNTAQVGIIIVGVILMAAISLSRVGGFEALLSAMPAEKSDPLGLGFAEFVSLMLISGPGVLCNQVMWQTIASAKSKKTAYTGILAGALVGSVVSVSAVLIGMAGTQFLPASTGQDQVYPAMIAVLFNPAVGGIFVVTLLAAILSSSTSLILGLTSILGNNVYKEYINPQATSAQMLKIFRFLSVAVGAAALAVAIAVNNGIWSFYALITPFATVALVCPSIVSIFWKRTTKPGIVSAMTLAMLVSLVWQLMGNPLGMDKVIVGMLVSLVTVVLVSLVTKNPEPSGNTQK